jgi:pSer/pThr/pTyr-binding forkhead associated (FHA) protein
MKSWRLFTVIGPDSGKTIPIAGLIRFGRDSDNEICIRDTQVSRCHAQIELVGDSYVIMDIESTNGTFVNDKRIGQSTHLRVGDSISIGPARFLVLEEATGALG